MHGGKIKLDRAGPLLLLSRDLVALNDVTDVHLGAGRKGIDLGRIDIQVGRD